MAQGATVVSAAFSYSLNIVLTRLSLCCFVCWCLFRDKQVGKRLVAALEPLWLRHGVDLTMAGHHHSYQRTCAVARGSCASACSDGSTPAPTHVVAGHGGAGLSDIRLRRPPLFAFAQSRSHGFLVLEASRTQLTIRALRSSDRTVIDTFTLRKGAASPVAACAPTTAWWWRAAVVLHALAPPPLPPFTSHVLLGTGLVVAAAAAAVACVRCATRARASHAAGRGASGANVIGRPFVDDRWDVARGPSPPAGLREALLPDGAVAYE